MPLQTCNLGTLKCTFGMAPAMFMVLPIHRTMTNFQPAANIMDHIPMVNIMPFGMCQSPSNPVVAAATAAALGVLTPMPCIPATPAPWVAGAPTVILDKFPALDNISTLNCIWGGVITFANPGQQKEMIP